MSSCCESCGAFVHLRSLTMSESAADDAPEQMATTATTSAAASATRLMWVCSSHQSTCAPRPVLPGARLWHKTYKKREPNSVHFPEMASFDETLPTISGIPCSKCNHTVSYYMEEPDGRMILTCAQCRHITKRSV